MHSRLFTTETRRHGDGMSRRSGTPCLTRRPRMSQIMASTKIRSAVAKRGGGARSGTACLTYYSVPPCLRGDSNRHGLTLVELLVAIFVILSLTVLAIPVIAPAIGSRSMREATAQVKSYFDGARARAIAAGHPVGVMIERMSGLRQAAMTLSYVEVPGLYSGDTMNSRLVAGWLEYPNNSGKFYNYVAGVIPPLPLPPNGKLNQVIFDGWNGMIRTGDALQVNYQGHRYRMIHLGGNVWIVGEGNGPAGASAPASFWTYSDTTDQPLLVPVNQPKLGDLNSGATLAPIGPGLPYQIIRQPTKSAGRPLTLPDGVVIDLEASGIGDQPGWRRAHSFNNDLDTDDSEEGAPFTRPKMSIDMFFCRDQWGRSALVNKSLINATNNRIDVSLQDKPVMIMFGSDGTLSDFYCVHWSSANSAWIWGGRHATGPVHLLLGQRDKIPVESELADMDEPTAGNFDDAELQRRVRVAEANWGDLANRWITIDTTGLVTVNENAAVDEAALDAIYIAAEGSNPATNGNQRLNRLLSAIYQARQLAIQSRK